MLEGHLALSRTDLVLTVAASWLLYKFLKAARIRAKTTQLCGPPSSSWLFGVTRETSQGDSGPLLERWGEEYGGVYQIPTALGSQQIILLDTKAINHFFTKDTFSYTMDTFTKKAVAKLLGKGLIYAEGESHRRQRRALSSAFSNAAIRSLTSVFYDSAYKAKTAWDAIIDGASSNEVIIDVQEWMSRISLDTIGIAGFDHNFATLDGRPSDVAALFDSFNATPTAGVAIVITLLSPVLPYLWDIPTKRSRLTKKFYDGMQMISETLLERSRKEREAGETGSASRSIIGALLKAENADAELNLSPDEVLAQMRLLLLAGYETTSITLTWALIELSLHPEKQDRLRAELAENSQYDPTYDQFINGLPYLDAISREILRIHPPVEQIIRVAVEDDIVPLSKPVTTASGKQVNSVAIARGAGVQVPISAINKSEEIWGADAKLFAPERWIDEDPERWIDEEIGLTARAKEVQGYHHLMTFVDGPRICLGRAFAVAEFKAVLSVLIRNYQFSMRDGPETKLAMTSTLLPRPKVDGEGGYALPMRVRRLEG